MPEALAPAKKWSSRSKMSPLGRGSGEEGVTALVVRVSVGGDKKVLETDSGEG